MCCDSSGNHGQALSWAASQANVVCHVAVPKGAPEVKVRAIENYGGRVHYCEPNDAGRVAKRSELENHFQAEMIHPSQDPRVIAGQGRVRQKVISRKISDVFRLFLKLKIDLNSRKLTMSSQFYVHLGAREQFSFSNHQVSSREKNLCF